MFYNARDKEAAEGFPLYSCSLKAFSPMVIGL